MKKILFTLLCIIPFTVYSQEMQTPSEKTGFAKVTSYDELTSYLLELDKSSDILKVEEIGKSVQDRNVYVMKFSSSTFGKDASKIRVMILAQQHGNEQSGKEGALLLAANLLKPENQYLFNLMDVAIVPQMNPDGSEINKRRNGNDMDLNRNHLILTEPETKALHRLFDQYLFEVTMDVHEFYPFGETWKEFGYRNASSELLGITTNINVSKKIRDVSKQAFLPFMKKYFDDRNISNFIYSPGGPPEIEYIRHSTFDINDGRQSFGIQNSFSVIQEGMNGIDDLTENLEHRAQSQMAGMRGLLEYTYQNKKELKKLVSEERELLLKSLPGTSVSIQNEHAGNGEKLKLPVYSYSTQTDSVITVIDYRPVVKSIYDVLKPSAYLIPKQSRELVEWLDRQAITYEPYEKKPGDRIEQYQVNRVDSIDFEGDTVVDPMVAANDFTKKAVAKDYLYVPTAQLKGNLMVIALEPKSMLGLVTYKQFQHLLVAGGKFPVLRVLRK